MGQKNGWEAGKENITLKWQNTKTSAGTLGMLTENGIEDNRNK